MYHWYVLTREACSSGLGGDTAHSSLVSWGVPNSGLDAEVSLPGRLMVLGAIETFPLVLLPIVAMVWPDLFTVFPMFLLGAALTTLLCWCLRNQVPKFPIHVTEQAVSTADSVGTEVEQNVSGTPGLEEN